MQSTHPPILVIVGTTASGKSDLAVALALRYGGEVISADSRQVYQQLNETTGKITQEEMREVPHHMLSIINPGETYNAHDFADQAMKCIQEIYDRENIPIIAGGSGFYIDTLLFEGVTAKVPPDPSYRKRMEKVNLQTLQQTLHKKDHEAYKRIDVQNPQRLIRALEILRSLKKFPIQKKKKRYAYHMIGITHARPHLRERIAKRLDNRFKAMTKEIQALLDSGIPKEWFEKLGLECRHIAIMLTENISKEKTKENLMKAIFAYAKRQETWLKQHPEVTWYHENQLDHICRNLDSIYTKRTS